MKKDEKQAKPSEKGAVAPKEGGTPGRIDADRAADDAPDQAVEGEDLKKRQDQLLDEALEETYPASDPIAPKQIV